VTDFRKRTLAWLGSGRSGEPEKKGDGEKGRKENREICNLGVDRVRENSQ